MVLIFSKAKINGKNILEKIDSKQKEEITAETRDYWKSLRNYKSRSQFGIAKNTYGVIESITNNETLSLPTSILLKKEFGEKDACMGVPINITPKGVMEIQDIEFNESEQELFKKSVQTIHNNIQSI